MAGGVASGASAGLTTEDSPCLSPFLFAWSYSGSAEKFIPGGREGADWIIEEVQATVETGVLQPWWEATWAGWVLMTLLVLLLAPWIDSPQGQ